MTIPTTPTGGEPTAGQYAVSVAGRAYDDGYQAGLAARVAELEGMLAVAREALTQAGMELHEAANILNGRRLIGTADLFYTASSKVASAIAQLDKEAGGK